MFSLFLKVLIPAALAVSVRGAYRPVVSPESLQGTYQVISSTSPRCNSGSLTVEFDASANSVKIVSEGSEVFVFPSINGGQIAWSKGTGAEQESGNQTTWFDGYGELKNVVGNTTSMESITTTASFHESDLTITRSTQIFLGRGHGGSTETCVLRRN